MSIQVINKNTGPKIAYQVSGTKITLGDEIMLNCAKYQREWAVHLDVCSNRDKQLILGTGDGLYYVAQLDLPPVQYEPQPAGAQPTEGAADALSLQAPPKPMPIDMNAVVLTLWSLDCQIPAQNKEV